MSQVAGFAELETLLTEFFVTTNNQRKKQIEGILDGLKNSPEAWKQALMMLNQSNNPYILFFACSVLEETLRSNWSSLVRSNDHLNVRKFILDYLSNISSKNAQPFVLTKICAVLVNIAKNDFPAQYPNYFNDINQFLSNPASVHLGVLLIKLTSEEFTVARDIPSQRKNEIKAALAQQVPYLLSRIVEVLGAMYTQNVVVSGSDSRSNFDKNQTALYLVRDCFETILHLFSWIPLNEILQPAQLDTIFKYIQLNDATSLLAFDCVNEVMSKNYVPKQFEQFLMQIFSQVFILLQKVTTVDLANLNSDFVQKITLFTSLFVSNHLKRVESNPNFSFVQDFLALLFKYTLMQPNLEGFLDCLDIWSVFIDYLKAQEESNASNKAKYSGGFIMICLELLRKSTFQHNAAQLNMLAEEESDSFESEIDEHIGNCVKLIGQIADLYADEVITQLVPMLVEFISNIKTLHQVNEGDAKRILKDGATALRTLSVIGNHFADAIRTKYQVGESIMKLLMETLAYTQQQQIFRFGVNGIRLVAEMFGTFRAFTPWLAALSALLRENNFPGGVAVMNSIVSGLLDFIIAVQDAAVPSDISLAAAILFKSIASTVRPGNIASFPKIENLLQNAYQLTSALAIEVQEQIYVALSLVILLPFPNVAKDAQNWPLRGQQFKALLDQVLAPFAQLCKSPGFAEQGASHPNSIALVTRTLKIVAAIFSEFKGESSNIGTESKSILQSSTVEFLQLTSSLFLIYLSNYPVLELILNLFVNVFDSMSVIDANLIQQTITMFSQIIHTQLPAICASKDLNGIIVACKFEQILSLLVQKPSAPIDHILGLAISTIGPVVLAPTCIAVEVRSNYFQLLYDIMMNQRSKIDATVQVVMEAFVTSFKLPDIEEVRRVIKLLDELNQKKKLFSNTTFRESITAPFSIIILSILVSKSHDLLREHLTGLLYQLVEPNPVLFFGQVLPEVLGRDTTLTPEQRQRLLASFSKEMDSPTFTQNVNNFISDYYYFKGGK